MEYHIDPAHNLACRHRFTCAAARCPGIAVKSEPACYVDKFNRYQPAGDIAWHRRDWEDINRITWREVFSLKESWIYGLIIIVITVFIFMMMVAIRVILKINLYS